MLNRLEETYNHLLNNTYLTYEDINDLRDLLLTTHIEGGDYNDII